MRNFVIKFGKILEICKKFAGNLVNEKGNAPRRGVVPTFSDLEVVAFSIKAEAVSIDSENYLFTIFNKECPDSISNLILGYKGYLSAPVQLNLFETANNTLDYLYRLNQRNWSPPTWTYKCFRKEIETVFTQLNGHLIYDTPLSRRALARQKQCPKTKRSF